jgi:hypothetical protein
MASRLANRREMPCGRASLKINGGTRCGGWRLASQLRLAAAKLASAGISGLPATAGFGIWPMKATGASLAGWLAAAAGRNQRESGG